MLVEPILDSMPAIKRGGRGPFARHTAAARKVGGRPARSTQAKQSSQADYSSVAVREWAKANKIELSARGRIPKNVLDQFRAAGN